MSSSTMRLLPCSAMASSIRSKTVPGIRASKAERCITLRRLSLDLRRRMRGVRPSGIGMVRGEPMVMVTRGKNFLGKSPVMRAK